MDGMNDLNDLPDDLAKALEALDARAARAASRVDAGRVEARLLERLRTEPEIAAPWQPLRVLRIAAALAVLVVSGALVRMMVVDGRPPVVAALPVEVPESLSAGQVEAVLDAVAAVRADTSAIAATVVSVEDLNEAELRALLQAMQSDMEGSL
jgi:hypothetical protein